MLCAAGRAKLFVFRNGEALSNTTINKVTTAQDVVVSASIKVDVF